MVKKGKLRAALDAHRGVNYSLEHDKKVRKQAEKKKRAVAKEEEGKASSEGIVEPEITEDGAQDSGWESEEQDDDGHKGVDLSHIDESDSDSEIRDDDDDDDDDDEGEEQEEEDEDGAEDLEDDDIPLSDLEDLDEEEKEDILPHQRLTINNTSALLQAVKSISLPISKLPFSEHQSITSDEPTSIENIDDDLNRELAFYKQSLSAVKDARALLRKEGVSFSRPTDYFAEMVKSDEHMGKIKQKLVDEAAGKKAAAEARKQRDLKKFGKQVQVAKLQERDKAKREALEKIQILKRKRQGADIENANEEDMFDVALESAGKPDARDRSSRRGEGGRPEMKRQKRDSKYGFGGKKRFSKSGDAISTGDMSGFSVKKMKSQKKGSQRPGKSRRKAGR